jgi:hydroxyethylthiazole kinase-like uncharacterized protein yjeF
VSEQVLTVAQMQAAEQALVDAGTSIEELMQRAGRGAAEWVWRLAAGRSVTVLCGPGNNGGDGYVIAETLRGRGLKVAVVAPIEPATDAARAARAAWRGDVATTGEGVRGAILVDCLFGSGLSRPLSDSLASLLGGLAQRHDATVAVDLPSGVESDSGVLLSHCLPAYRLTLALGAWKYAHWLMPAAARMGERRLVEIGVGRIDGAAVRAPRARLAAPASDAHKYTRGLVVIVAGAMEGAALLACQGAMRSGAGAVRLVADRLHPAAPPDVILRPQPVEETLTDKPPGAILIGPGLGRDEGARQRMRTALAANRPTVIDADALSMLAPDDLGGFAAPLVMTPHGGELERLGRSFGLAAEGKLARARELARRAGAVVVAKGPDTVIAAPDGRTALAASPTSWLSVGGTGDVLAGVIAGRLAATGDPFRAACEGNCLHGKAARLAGPAFIASHVAAQLGAAYESFM